jgi:hypothetical protein
MIRKLLIDACGPEFALRYFLTDGESNFWNEKNQCWTKDFNEAGLWADVNEIGQKMHDLMMTQIPGELHQFTAPILVKVKTEQPVDVAALQEWLNRAVEIYINAKHGTGPGQSMVMLQIDWDQLIQKENNDVPK